LTRNKSQHYRGIPKKTTKEKTMNAEHTPGPWQRDRASGLKCDVRAENGRKVALTWGLGCGDNYREKYRAECDANAHLIAAAPELLEAMESARRDYIDKHGIAIPEEQGNYPLLVKMNSAIAKAKGDNK
jgi:hypothetical protein